MRALLLLTPILLVMPDAPLAAQMRARALGVAPGVFTPGALNAITDVAGVRVGHATLVAGDSVRTGVTAIVPHGGDAFHERVPAAIVVGNGFGKLLGSTQVNELGELETPVLLTCTLCVWRAADAMVAWLLEQPGMEGVRSINPVVAETNDGGLNDIRARPVTAAAVREALESAHGGAVAEGSVGAGMGTIAFGWKGGIGTSSRVLPPSLGGWTVGVLVQSNFGGVLQVLGAPVGKELGKWAFQRDVAGERGDGSIIMVVATDAPLSDRNLRRLGERALMGLARTGSSASNGSGDYVIAFSTAESVRRRVMAAGGAGAAGAGAAGAAGKAGKAGKAGAPPEPPARGDVRTVADLDNESMSGLFEAVIEATEESIYDSLFMATTVTSRFGTADAIPLDRVRAVLAKYRVGQR